MRNTEDSFLIMVTLELTTELEKFQQIHVHVLALWGCSC